MIIPELPNYLTSLGGAEYKGYIISLFTLTAALSRPFSGKLTDIVGRIPIMVFGAGISFIISFSYPIFQTVMGFLFLRLIHGFSTGFKPTATSAFIADIVPASRRGEAMGIQGIATSLGMAIGPSMGSWLSSIFSINTLFYIAGLTALSSILIILNLKETIDPSRKRKFKLKELKITVDDFYEPNVIKPAVIFLLSTFSFGVLLTLIPDYSESIGVKNKGIYFTFYVLSSLLVRIFAGKLSDRHGRSMVVNVGLLIQIFSMLALALYTNQYAFYTSAVLFGLSSGMISPSIFAWVVDLAKDGKLGKAFATMYISLEVGIGVGAFTSGYIYANKDENFPLVFTISAILVAIAFLYGIFKSSVPRSERN
jgi:MFS family permease